MNFDNCNDDGYKKAKKIVEDAKRFRHYYCCNGPTGPTGPTGPSGTTI